MSTFLKMEPESTSPKQLTGCQKIDKNLKCASFEAYLTKTQQP